jgi:hypothetical protein
MKIGADEIATYARDGAIVLKGHRPRNWPGS